MTQTTEQILALADKCGIYKRLTPIGTDEVWAYTTDVEAFFHAAIESYKAELLEEVGEPVAWMDEDGNVSKIGHPRYPLFTRRLYTSDQVAAAVAKATKPMEERICDLTACKWPEAYTVIPVKINGQLHATSQAISEEMESARQQLAKSEQRIAELEAENERLKREAADWRNEFSEDRDENNELRYQLAASQLRETQLREALNSAFGALEECRDYPCTLDEVIYALDQPTDTSALDAYVAEKVKDKYAELLQIDPIILKKIGESQTALWMNYCDQKDQIATLTRQRDLAVEALQFYMDHGICEATHYKVRETLSTIKVEVKE